MLAAERPLADSAFTTALRGSAFGPRFAPGLNLVLPRGLGFSACLSFALGLLLRFLARLIPDCRCPAFRLSLLLSACFGFSFQPRIFLSAPRGLLLCLKPDGIVLYRWVRRGRWLIGVAEVGI